MKSTRRPGRHALHVAAAALAILGASASGPAQDDSSLRTERMDRAVAKGLSWLVRNQAADGSWRSDGRSGSYPTAMTALAGMAFLGEGSTPTRGRYFKAVRDAVDFLVRQAQPNGLITTPFEESRSMYGHGFATLFLAQIYGMEEDAARQDAIHEVLVGAIELIAQSQSEDGGWLYQPDSQGDEGSVTVTQIQALRACRNAGITVPSTTIDRAVGYIRKSANSDGSIRYSVDSGGSGRPPITAAAVAVLYNAGRYDDPLAEKALAFARRELAVDRGTASHWYYAHLYLSQALYQRGGEDWTQYFGRLGARLAQLQAADGHWDDTVGPTYATALSLTMLQLPDAKVPIHQR